MPPDPRARLMLLALLVYLAAAAPPGAAPVVFASFNNARAMGVAHAWLHAGAPEPDRLDRHHRAASLLQLPAAYGIVCAGAAGSDVSLLVCHRRPGAHVVRLCLWSAELGPEARCDYLARAADWHMEHISRNAQLTLLIAPP